MEKLLLHVSNMQTPNKKGQFTPRKSVRIKGGVVCLTISLLERNALPQL